MKIKPNYENMGEWEFYCNDIEHEYKQCFDEGLDIEKYKDIFAAVKNLPKTEIRKNFSDVLFEAVCNAPIREDYKYNEPSDLEGIKALRKKHIFERKTPDGDTLKSKISGAWMGRVCGCLLGKPVEGIRTNEFYPMLKEMGNYPLTRYMLASDITEEMYEKYDFHLRDKCFADAVHGMPVDDDTNYVVLAQKIIEAYGKDFKPHDVLKAWVKCQSREAYFTAERVAFDNFIKGYEPPYSAMYKNPYREWIGAQIRGDYFGYINPGEPKKAAEMAFRDASISHIKNGIYGEMWVSAMIACAAVTDNIEDIILGGLGEIPETSRLYDAVTGIMEDYKKGKSYDDCVSKIHSLYDEHTGYGWCHTIPNAMIVTTALLYGEGDFGKSICMAVQPAFDTDCNGATVGSVIGMRNGISAIGEEWTKPVDDTLHTSIFGVGTVKISDMIEKTMKHIN
ncbi:MAG: ADP-ribosylglycohydrolase family protein [Ruminococcaceae bacterium]|nr:ADP-ribosylglycohydrolase family protein [Oscillospiraceae bacterium]